MDNDVLSKQAVENAEKTKSLLLQLKKSTENQSSIIESFKQGWKYQQKLLCEKDSEITELKKGLTKLKSQEAKKSKKLCEEANVRCQRCEIIEKQLLEMKDKLEKLQKSEQTLKNNFCRCDDELTTTKDQLASSQNVRLQLEKTISKLGIENTGLEEKNIELRKTKCHLDEQIAGLRTENNRLETDLRRIEIENNDLRAQVDDWVKKRHSTMCVQMYAAVNRELCEKMMNELEDMLRTHLEMYDTLIQVDKYKDPPPDSSLPLLILCINASRLGTDVNQALSNINRSRTIAVIVLHHKEMHALPRQPSEKLLIGSEYKNINLIVDIAYLTTKGIYPCEMNNRSLDKLFSFIKSNP